LFRARAQGSGQRFLKGHSKTIHDLAFSPDGRFLASRAGDEFFLWNYPRDGQYQRINHQVQAWQGGFQFSRDGRLLGFVDSRFRLRLLDTSNVEHRNPITPKLDFVPKGGPVFSPTSSVLLLQADDETLYLIDYETGASEQLFHAAKCGPLGMSADGQRVWAQQDGKLAIWEIAEKRTIGEAIDLNGHDLEKVCLDEAIREVVWDGGTSSLCRLNQNPAAHWQRLPGTYVPPQQFVIDRSTDTILAGSWDHFVYVWRLNDRSLVTRLAGHQDQIWCLAVGPDGAMATGGPDQQIVLWNLPDILADNAPLGDFDVGSAVVASTRPLIAARNPDGDTLLVDLATKKVIQTLEKGGYPLAFGDEDYQLITLNQGEIITWNLRATSEVLTRDARIRTLPLGFESAIGPYGSNWQPNRLAVAGDVVALHSNQQQVHVVDFRSGKTVLKLDQGPANLGLSANGQILVSNDNLQRGQLEFREVATGKLISQLDTGQERWLNKLTFSPDGRWLATLCMDSTVKIWDVDLGKLLHTLRGHKQGVFGGAFSPDSQTLATISHDQTARLWNVDTGREVGLIRLPAPGPDVRFSSDGNYLLLAGWPETEVVHRGESAVTSSAWQIILDAVPRANAR